MNPELECSPPSSADTMLGPSICLSPPPPPFLPGCPFFLGDVSGDATINVLDVIIVANFTLGLTILSEESLCAADVDFSGSINVSVSPIT